MSQIVTYRRVLRAAAGMTALAAFVSIGACGGATGPRGSEPVSLAQRASEGQRVALEAQKSAKAGKRDEAIDLYRRALSYSRDMHGAWNNLGVLLAERGQYLEAREAFQTAADLAPADPRPVANIGDLFTNRGYFAQAMEHYELALERDPQYLPALRGAVRAAAMLGRADEPTARRIQLALFTETDAQWLAFFQRQRERVANSAAQPAP
jgi:tetratricopeptide (TPR) repeat protein